MYKFYAFINRMKYIKRWSLMRSIKEENIMEHTQQVAMLAHALGLIANKKFNKTLDINKIVLLAQYHEVGEVITGDLPTPIKYFNPEIKSAYKDLEKGACEKLVNMLPDFLQEEYKQYIMPNEQTEEYKIVKCADKLSAYLKCVEEVLAGNSEFKKAKQTILGSLKAMKSQEVDYFLKEIAPSYELTLDELD